MREFRECRAAQNSAKAMSASENWTITMIELPGVIESGMPGRNGQRKPGTTRGSPRRSRTAKALRISRRAVKSRCARERGGWGRISVDGLGQHNPASSEDPWGGGVMTSKAVRNRVHGPTQCGTTAVTMRCTKGERKPDGCRCTPGAGLNRQRFGKTPPEKPAFQPY